MSRIDADGCGDLPGRLVEGQAELAELLRRANRDAGRGLDEPAMWSSLSERLARKRRGVGSLAGVVACAAVGATVALLLLPDGTLGGFQSVQMEPWEGSKPPAGSGGRSPSVQMEPWEGSKPPAGSGGRSPPAPASRGAGAGNGAGEIAAAGEVGRAGRAGPQMVELRPGASEVGPATVILSDDGAASVTADGRETRIALATGSVELRVAKRAPDSPFEVTAGPYVFRVLGTAFRVRAAGASVNLEVSEGRVAVLHEGKALATIGAGGHWNGALSRQRAASLPDRPLVVARAAETSAPESATVAAQPAEDTAPVVRPPAIVAPPDIAPPPRPIWPAAAAAGAPPAAPTSPRSPSCASLAATGRTAEAAGCYQLAATSGSALEAELALYELGRLRRYALNDPTGALDSLQAHRTRFPSGNLRPEVDMSIVEILPTLGRHRQALEESERLLSTAWGMARSAELRLLRGNIYREGLDDCSRAVAEYAAATGNTQPALAARFLRGVCLEVLGRTSEAAEAYRSYLGGSGTTHAAEARLRLSRLPR